MSIGFTFTGKARKREQLIKAAREAAKRLDYRVGVGEQGICVALCPMGTVDFSWKRESGFMGQWLISGSCVSTPAGAGFHKAAVEFLDLLGKKCLKDLAVEDETGYYNHRQFDRMRQEHFLPWLDSLLKLSQRELDAENYRNLCLCWDLGQYQPQDVPGTVVTPVGRFSVQWMTSLVQRRGLQALADRFFLWDHEERGALYYRNCALKKLWEDCYFAPSQRSEEDRQINQDILEHLEKAAQLDPNLPLPLGAYREVCILDDRDFALPEDVPELEEEFPIGYRRGEVIQPFDDLRLALPGCYRYEWEPSGKGGGGLWSDEETDSPVWRASGFRNREGDAQIQEELFADLEDVESHTLQGGLAKWGWKMIEEHGQTYRQVLCQAVSGPALFVVSVTYRQEAEREDIYRRLRALDVVGPNRVENHTGQY